MQQGAGIEERHARARDSVYAEWACLLISTRVIKVVVSCCIPAAMVLSVEVAHGSVPVVFFSVSVARRPELELGLEPVEGAVNETTLAAVCVNNVSMLSPAAIDPLEARSVESINFVGTV